MNFEHPTMVSQPLTGGDDKESTLLGESSVRIPDLVSSVGELRLPDPSPNLSRMLRFSSSGTYDGSSHKCE